MTRVPARPPASADPVSGDPTTTWRLLHTSAIRRPEALARQALRHRSGAVLDALARAATRGEHDAATLRAQVLDQGGPPPSSLSPTRVRALTGVATVWAGMLLDEDELQAAATVFARLLGDGPAEHLTAEGHLLAGQTLFLAGRHDELEQLLPRLDLLPPDAAHYLRTDLAHPGLGRPDADPQRWHQLLGQPFADHGLAPVTVSGDDLAGTAGVGGTTRLFDQLSAPGTVAGSAGGQLVTVVMPCYRPDRGLLASVRSIVEQTWADLEILVMDDASGPAWAELYEEVSGLDERVEVVHLERNGGSYLAREAAIARARGRLITFQDADDWSHPRRVEDQVAALAGSDAPMSRSRAVRARDDLTHQWLGYLPTRPNASSLLVRREVFDRWGGFVPVRKGADSEFAERIHVLAGEVVDTHTPLAVTRLSAGSLSRGDFTHSWMAPDRLAFRGAFMAWHRQLVARRDAGTELGLTTEDLHHLPFPVPTNYTAGLPAARHTPERLVGAYLGDFSRAGSSPSARWVRELLDAAPPVVEPVGLWTQETPSAKDLRRPRMSDAWFDLVQLHPGLRPLSRTDDVQVGRIAVVDPEGLALAGGQECRVRADVVELWLTPRLVLPDRSLVPADLLGLSDACAAWFGVRPTWVTAPHLDETDRDVVLTALPGMDIGRATTVPVPPSHVPARAASRSDRGEVVPDEDPLYTGDEPFDVPDPDASSGEGSGDADGAPGPPSSTRR